MPYGYTPVNIPQNNKVLFWHILASKKYIPRTQWDIWDFGIFFDKMRPVSAVHKRPNKVSLLAVLAGHIFKHNQIGSRRARIISSTFCLLSNWLVEHGLLDFGCFPISGLVWWLWPWLEWVGKGKYLVFTDFQHVLSVSGLVWWLWQLPTLGFEGCQTSPIPLE